MGLFDFGIGNKKGKLFESPFNFGVHIPDSGYGFSHRKNSGYHEDDR